MEVEMNKYVIQFENGRSVTVTARNLEDALEEFKLLRIETATKEIRVMTAWERYNKHKQRGVVIVFGNLSCFRVRRFAFALFL
jgi:hypothetical protein